MASFSVVELAFPQLLEPFGLHSFDFCKVIFSFVLHEPTLPAHLKNHFVDVETKIIESLAWVDGSPLHDLMQEYQTSGRNASGVSQLSSRAKMALEQFLKKVLHLGANRIQDICLRLLLPTLLIQQVWACLKVVIYREHTLMHGRHLDQIIMCSVYGVCKVNQKHLTFRNIIDQYKRQSFASPKVFREVRMLSAADKPQDIIRFYNKVFIPSMKDFLVGTCQDVMEGPSSALHADNSSSGCAGSCLPHGAASPQRVSGQREVYVSHPRTPSVNMTPRTRTLWSFSDTPAHSAVDKLSQINNSLNTVPDSAADALRQLQQGRPAPGIEQSNVSADGGSRKRPGLHHQLSFGNPCPGKKPLMQRRFAGLASDRTQATLSDADAELEPMR